MKVIDIIKTASANLWRNKGRTILTIIAIFIGAFTISMTIGVNIGVNDYINKQLRDVGGKNELIIMPKVNTTANLKNEPKEYKPDQKNGSVMQNEQLTSKDLKKIQSVKNIKKAKPFQMVNTNYIQGAKNKKYIFSAMPSSIVKIDLEAGRALKTNGKDYEINLAPEYVKSLGFSSTKNALNKKVKIGVPITATGQEKIIEATIVGIRNTSLIQAGQSIINSSLTNKIIEINETGLPKNLKGKFSSSYATMKSNLSDKEINDLKNKLSDKGYTAMTVDDQIGTIRNVVNTITSVLTIFGAIALLAASFGIINTLYMSVQERTREIGLMKAMGMGRAKVFLMFSIEAVWIGLWGSLVGVLGAIGAGAIINKLAADTFLKELTGFTLVQFSLPAMLMIMGIIMLIAFLAGTFPANRAARLDPITALRYE